MRLPIILLYLLSIAAASAADRPNILIMMSDDQSFPHASAYGSKMVNTPNFDRIARDGILFNNAFCAAPGCSPSRAAFLTGRHIWQIEHAGTHASSFDKKYRTFMDLLAAAGTDADSLQLLAVPFHATVAAFIDAHEKLFVVEQNRDAQMRTVLINELQIDPARLTSVLHYDGSPLTAQTVVEQIGHATGMRPATAAGD